MSEPIDRDQVLINARRIEELCKTAILVSTPKETEPAQLGCWILSLIFDGYSALMALLGTAGEYHVPTIVRTMLPGKLHSLRDEAAKHYERLPLVHKLARKRPWGSPASSTSLTAIASATRVAQAPER